MRKQPGFKRYMGYALKGIFLMPVSSNLWDGFRDALVCVLGTLLCFLFSLVCIATLPVSVPLLAYVARENERHFFDDGSGEL